MIPEGPPSLLSHTDNRRSLPGTKDHMQFQANVQVHNRWRNHQRPANLLDGKGLLTFRRPHGKRFDGTEIATGGGRLYLDSVLDMASRRILGHALGEHHDAGLTIAALLMSVVVTLAHIKAR
jgi:hypothetical protein